MSTASSNASPAARSVALRRAPASCARRTPSFTPGLNPKSSAFTINRGNWPLCERWTIPVCRGPELRAPVPETVL